MVPIIMLYQHGLPPFVNSYSHEQDMQAVAHHIEKGERPCTQPSAKYTRVRNRFWAYSEVTSNEDVSSEDFIYETPSRMPMTAGQTHQDQLNNQELDIGLMSHISGTKCQTDPYPKGLDSLTWLSCQTENFRENVSTSELSQNLKKLTNVRWVNH